MLNMNWIRFVTILVLFGTAWSCSSRKRRTPTTPKPTATPITLPIGQCGKTTVNTNTFVIAGQTSTTGQWPWQVAIYKNGYFICGGSLIDSQWVLTAAHCLTNLYWWTSLRVVIGDLDRGKSAGSEQTIYVTRYVKHSSYRSSGFDYDVGLLKLAAPAKLNDYVKPVCLPNQGENVAVGTNCFISGWGKTAHPGRSVNQLQHAGIKVISNNVCKEKNGNGITTRMVCARNDNGAKQSGCQGDSGGPFVCKQSDGSWKLHGAVSWGSASCDVTYKNTVFARISEFRSWIDSTMNRN